MAWIKLTDISSYSYLCSIGTGSAAMGIAVHTSDSSNGGNPYFMIVLTDQYKDIKE